MVKRVAFAVPGLRPPVRRGEGVTAHQELDADQRERQPGSQRRQPLQKGAERAHFSMGSTISVRSRLVSLLAPAGAR